MSERVSVEKFSMSELEKLRAEMAQSGIDSWRAAEVVSAFLTGRGYGVDNATMRAAVTRIDPFGGSIDSMQAVLETVAYVM